jgi:hypothetical protein
VGGGAGHEIGEVCAGVLSSISMREGSEQNDEARQTKRYSLPLDLCIAGRHAMASGVGRAFSGHYFTRFS